MRYYDIKIFNKAGTLVIPNYMQGTGATSTYTSYVGGQTNPAALNIELDIPLYPFAQPRQGSRLVIWGVSILELAQSNDLNYFTIMLEVGMKKGLPLAKPDQAGLVVHGTIFQAFGNWEDNDQYLAMSILPLVGNTEQTAPVNFTFKWPINTKMADAIDATLAVAYPLYTRQIDISDVLIANTTQTSFYPTFADFAKNIYDLSKQPQYNGIQPQGGGPYTGVDVVIRGKTIYVYDGTGTSGDHTFNDPLVLAFEDMIGQPTWIGPFACAVKVVMRADINVGDYFKFPTALANANLPGVVTTTPGASFPNAPARNKSIFQGIYKVVDLHLFGNFRQPDASSWVAVITGVAVNPPNPPTGNGAAAP